MLQCSLVDRKQLSTQKHHDVLWHMAGFTTHGRALTEFNTREMVSALPSFPQSVCKLLTNKTWFTLENLQRFCVEVIAIQTDLDINGSVVSFICIYTQ